MTTQIPAKEIGEAAEETDSQLAVISPREAQRRHEAELIKAAEGKLKYIEHLIRAPGFWQSALAGSLKSTGESIRKSKSSKSVGDYAETSVAAAKASRHLNEILSGSSASAEDDHSFGLYRAKIDAMPAFSRLDANTTRPFHGTEAQWQLIKVAATESSRAYEEASLNPDGIVFEPARDIKASVFYVKAIGERETLVAAVRGSVNLGDWCLNFNGEPTRSEKLLDGTVDWHRGFKKVAEKMEVRMVQVIKYLRYRHERATSILFTGHSAGGAIAQIFYAASFSLQTRFFEAVSGLDVHCITFGAPPVASIPIPLKTRTSPSHFIAFINEGDPVPLAQEAFITTLVSVYILSPEELEELYPEGGAFEVPAPILRVSGDCVVLRDIAPDDEEGKGVEAVAVDSQVVEQKLFGDPFVHLMAVYLDRVNTLAENAVPA